MMRFWLLLLCCWVAFPICAQEAARSAAANGYDALNNGARSDAVAAFRRALQSMPPLTDRERFQVAADLGFLLDSLGQRAEAADAYAQALAIRFDPLIQRALAYALLAAGKRAQAEVAFNRALMEDHLMAEADRLMIRRELRALQDIVALEAYGQIRAEPGQRLDILSSPAIIGSQGGVQGALLLKRWLPLDVRPTARLLWAFDGASLNIVRGSVQGGLGIAVKPLQNFNLIFTAERLLAVGTFALNEWLFRASWSTGQGYEAPPQRRIWPFWSVYLDGAWIGIPRRAWIVAANLRGGGGFRMTRRFALRPFLALDRLQQGDGVLALGLWEGGPGLSLLFTPIGPARKASSLQLELELRWRQRLAGTAGNRSALTMTLALRY